MARHARGRNRECPPGQWRGRDGTCAVGQGPACPRTRQVRGLGLGYRRRHGVGRRGHGSRGARHGRPCAGAQPLARGTGGRVPGVLRGRGERGSQPRRIRRGRGGQREEPGVGLLPGELPGCHRGGVDRQARPAIGILQLRRVRGGGCPRRSGQLDPVDGELRSEGTRRARLRLLFRHVHGHSARRRSGVAPLFRRGDGSGCRQGTTGVRGHGVPGRGPLRGGVRHDEVRGGHPRRQPARIGCTGRSGAGPSREPHAHRVVRDEPHPGMGCSQRRWRVAGGDVPGGAAHRVEPLPVGSDDGRALGGTGGPPAHGQLLLPGACGEFGRGRRLVRGVRTRDATGGHRSRCADHPGTHPARRHQSPSRVGGALGYRWGERPLRGRTACRHLALAAEDHHALHLGAGGQPRAHGGVPLPSAGQERLRPGRLVRRVRPGDPGRTVQARNPVRADACEAQ